ncbi:MAG TPA: S1C family serine protease [Acidimicrobiales bacterium]|nr:S1C family serine protease [Acidimicrobiales bacterium]
MDTGEPGDFEGEYDEEDESSPLGWLSPDDRNWRHPTEISLLHVSGQGGSGARGTRRQRQDEDHFGSAKANRRTSPRNRRVAATSALIASATAGAVITSIAFVGSGWINKLSGDRSISIVQQHPESLGAETTAAFSPQSTVPLTTAAPAANAVTTPAVPVSQDLNPTQKPISPGGTLLKTPGISRLSRSYLASVEVDSAGMVSYGSAVPLNSNGLFISSSLLSSGGTIRLTLPATAVSKSPTVVPASIVGEDTLTGIAVLKAEIPSQTEIALPPIDPGDQLVVGQNLPIVTSKLNSSSSATTLSAIFLASSVNVTFPDESMLLSASELQMSSAPQLGSVVSDSKGDVQAIITYVEAGTSSVQAFATPISVAEEMGQQIISSGASSHGWLGVTASDASATDGYGVLVSSVMNQSPAKAAGILDGDVIKSIEGDKISSILDLKANILLRSPGTPVVIEIDRQGTELPVLAYIGGSSGQ